MATTSTLEALPSSKLGTHQHWDSVYEREVENFAEHGDRGEVWFGEDAAQRMVNFLKVEAQRRGWAVEKTRILDLGTGNGHLLFGLLEDLDEDEQVAEPQHMLGIDYSAHSIQLCTQIAQNADDERCKDVRFEEVDFLNQPERLKDDPSGWDVVCDKGTLDAIALSSGDPSDKVSPVQQYVASLGSITKQGSMFLITSCNFTEKELIQIFSNDFEVDKVLPVPSFSFGGQTGSTTVTIAFKRK